MQTLALSAMLHVTNLQFDDARDNWKVTNAIALVTFTATKTRIGISIAKISSDSAKKYAIAINEVYNWDSCKIYLREVKDLCLLFSAIHFFGIQLT